MDQSPASIPAEVASDGAQPDLVVRLRRGDDDAFEELVRRYGGRMLATARRLLKDTAAAEDCLQDALLNAYRAIDRFEGRADLATWLHRITINSALMTLRTQRRLGERSLDDLQPQFDETTCRIERNWQFQETTDEMIQRRQVRDLVLACINDLPDAYRVVLMLRDIEELSTAEVAEALDMTEGAVKTRLHRARSALKKLLEPLWEDGQ